MPTGAILFNHTTNEYEDVPAERVGEALASGKYTAGGNTDYRAEGGLVTRPVEQSGAAAVQGETLAGAENARRAAAARREEQQALDSDKALSFVEGVGDALTLGLLHGTRPEDELRREADSGSALLGQLVGTGLGLKLPGPIKGLAEGGEKLGEGVARALLGEAESGFRGAVTRGLSEAGANAALMAASAFGHQITDAVIADKPFAAESIASETGVGALLGFGFGFAGSAFGQLARASRGAVEKSGLAVKESKAALDSVADLTRAWDDVVEQHAERVGVLRVLAEEGHISEGLLNDRRVALGDAKDARDALRALDPERALGGDAKEFTKWRDAVQRYQDAVARLDERMVPSAGERMAGITPTVPGVAGDIPRAPGVVSDADMAAAGYRSPMSEGLDASMTPEARAQYESVHGRPFEPHPGVVTPEGTENLGGRVTPTSGNDTNPGFRGGSATVVDPRVERFNKAPAEPRAPRDTVIEAQGRTSFPRQVAEAGERPAAQAETASDFVDHAKTRVDAAAQEMEIGTIPGETDAKKGVREYLNSWFKEFDSKPRVNFSDELNARLTKALDSIAKASGTRLDSAGALALMKALGIKEATGALGQRLDQVWSLGQAGKFAADEARGVKTPLRKGLAGHLQRYAVHKGARMAGAAMVGGQIGGPLGAVVGMAMTSAGFAGAAASTAGKLMTQIGKVGEALLRGRRATLAVRAAAGNRPYQYSDAGPIEDPVQRIQEVQRMAANPEAIRARVTKQLGDLALTSPELAEHLLNTAVNHVQAIAANAPAIMLTPLGKPVRPSGTAMQRFFDFENAMHDLPGTLQAIASGGANASQIQALQVGFPAVHAELVKNLLEGNVSLARLEEAKLKTIERVLGAPLTRTTTDPTITSRFQGNWRVDSPAARPAQSFKITAPKPTPVQASTNDRAPGNERIAR